MLCTTGSAWRSGSASEVRYERRGFAIAVFLPWLVAAVALLIGLGAWIPSAPRPQESTRAKGVDAAEMAMLRRGLATAGAENEALRQELDRLVAGGFFHGGKSASGATGAPASPDAGVAAAGGEPHELAVRLTDALARSAAGDEAARAEAAQAIWTALQGGPESFATLREAYESSPDSQSRKLLAASMLFSRSPEAVQFITDQALQEQDPDLRRVLSMQASKYGTPESAARLQGVFLDSLGNREDAELRMSAVRGLRFAKGEEVASALLGAASDPDEAVRLAAIDTLAARPDTRERVRNLLNDEPSERIRRIGNCRLLVGAH
jgi:hypothetical protein